jgi:glycosyltransferase involved in cell wall biosynthesis
MRVLQVCSAEGIGGGEVHVADLALGLAERGVDVELAVRPTSRLPELVERLAPGRSSEFQWHYLPFRNSVDLTSTRGVTRLIESRSVDVVHAHVARDYPVVALAAMPKRRARLVLTRHHYLPIKGNVVYRRLLAKATIIAVSESVRRTVIESLGVPASQVLKLSNWIDVDRAAEPRDRAAARHALGVTRRVAIAIVGQITPLKGHEEFLAAAARVVAARTDVEFLVVGEDREPGAPFGAWLLRRAAELGVEPYVRFLSFQDDLLGLFAAVDAVAIPSWNEAFSLVAVEAMAAGRAVVASEVGGLAEIVENETTGLLVPPRDEAALASAFLRLAEDPALVVHLGQHAKVSARRYARGPAIDRVVEVYRSVVWREKPFGRSASRR